MIEEQYIRDHILPKVKLIGRKLDYLLIENLFSNKEKEIIEELRTFQNDDFGFGNSLEADIRLPLSNVASTDIAITILESIKDIELKKPLIKEIVSYYENSYIKEEEAWEMVPKEVDDYPHAIWWNYDQLSSFTYGNPNPEIIGFLYQNRKYLTKIDINHQINKVVTYVKTKFIEEASMHSLLSVLLFYKRVDDDVKNLIKDTVQKVVDKEIKDGLDKWHEYALEPFSIYVIDKSFLLNHLPSLAKNLQFNIEKLKEGPIIPSWNWYQYEEVFEKVKHEWSGYLTYNVIKALRLKRG